MKGVISTLWIVLLFYLATVYAGQCTDEQMQKMSQGGLSPQEITRICNTASSLSLEEASEKLTSFAAKNKDHDGWYVKDLPRPGNIRLHNLKWYYDSLMKAGYVTRWEENRVRPGEIRLQLTKKGDQFIRFSKTHYGRYEVHCCDLEVFGVTCLTTNPEGDKARGVFEVAASDLFQHLQDLAIRYPVNLIGQVEFQRDNGGWKVADIWIDPRFDW